MLPMAALNVETSISVESSEISCDVILEGGLGSRRIVRKTKEACFLTWWCFDFLLLIFFSQSQNSSCL